VDKTLRAGEEVFQDLIRDRKRKGLDLYDEVWEGVYVMASLPSMAHQRLVHILDAAIYEVVTREKRGQGWPGANVSDRRRDWKENHRIPDLVVLLKDSRAVEYDAFIHGGPDFVVEIQSPGDPTEEKIEFYSEIQVQELLTIHRDKRTLRLFRHDGKNLVPVEPSTFEGKKWLVSKVVPLAFRRVAQQGKPGTTVRRTDGKPGTWTTEGLSCSATTAVTSAST
jgi:Uma2 family endonuclease